MSKKSKNTINRKDNTKLVNTFMIIGIVFLIATLVLMFVNKKENNNIKDISYQEYSEIIKEDKYNIILLTSPTCSHCLSYKPYVNLVAKENNLTVYNLDVSSISEEEYAEIHDKYSVLKEEYYDNEPSIPTPTTLIVRNGEEVTSVMGNIGQKGFTSLLKNSNIIK